MTKTKTEWPGSIRHLTPEQYREEVLGLPALPPESRHWPKLAALALVVGFALGYCASTPAASDDDLCDSVCRWAQRRAESDYRADSPPRWRDELAEEARTDRIIQSIEDNAPPRRGAICPAGADCRPYLYRGYRYGR